MSIKIVKKNLVITIPIKKIEELMGTNSTTVNPQETIEMPIMGTVDSSTGDIKLNDIQSETTTSNPVLPTQETGGDTGVSV
jgi:cytochrome c oxidase assembly protein Cox11